VRRQHLLAGAVALSMGGAALVWALSAPAPAPDPGALASHAADAAHGERVFWAAGCAGCHRAPGAENDPLVLSGGRRLASDFGTFVAPNVSMDPVHGIGAWSQADFARALLTGTSPQGQHYYPAFPYTTYAKMTVQDVVDLWAFWQDLPADATPDQPHELGFPFTLRRGLGLWKRLYLSQDFVASPDTPGRYLVEALGHCAECHTPRDSFGGLDRSRWMAGAPNPSGTGRIPALPPRWSENEITLYLQSGFTPSFDVVGGSMADVVAHLARLPQSDVAAIAAYLTAWPSR
jgi:mono/diheme cytochrome c family protein